MKKKPDFAGDAEPDTKEARAEIRARALGLLARREHAALELKRKLLQRGYAAGPIDDVVLALAAEGLLSETRFAEEWVRSRIARGQGPMKLRAGLRQQGLTDLQIQQALAVAEANWGQLATEVRRKRFGGVPPTSLVERARQTRFLESRGFAAEHIRQALGADSLD